MIARIWSGENKAYWLLLPLSWLYGGLVILRRRLYQWGILTVFRAKVPVIVVGNLSVGGNGKTPVVIYLVQQLQQKGYRVGVVSRGYGGKSDHYPLLVTHETPASEAGDEPVLIAQRTGAPLAVAPKRAQAVALLLTNHPHLDVIVTDDGLQHYALARDIEIVVINGQRGLGNGWWLPAGPLRERAERLNSVDFVVINGPTSLSLPNILTGQMRLIQGQAVNVKTGISQPLTELAHIHAIAGISDPDRFFASLSAVRLEKTTAFADHHAFSLAELAALVTPTQTLLMTEKDAVKCRSFAQENWWYIPIEAEIVPPLIDLISAKIVETKQHNIVK